MAAISMFGVDPGELLRSYGYLALIIGTFLEGETIVLVAGVLAQRDYLSPPLIALAAFTGSCASDQLMFILGRWKGMAIIQRFPRLEKNVVKATRLISRYETPLILGFRFIYGVRNVTPILMGLAGVSHLKFLVLNVIGAAVWAVSFTAAGYFSGHAIKVFMQKYPHAGPEALAAVVLAIALIWFIRKKRRQAREAALERAKGQDGNAADD